MSLDCHGGISFPTGRVNYEQNFAWGDNESDGLDIGVDKVFISEGIGERYMPDHLDLAQKGGRRWP